MSQETTAPPFTQGEPARARSWLATFAECMFCGGDMRAEHAHYRCATCGWRDSCCD